MKVSEIKKALGEVIYKEEQYVLLNKDNMVLSSGSLSDVLQSTETSYYDGCFIKVRQHDLHLHNNDKIVAI